MFEIKVTNEEAKRFIEEYLYNLEPKELDKIFAKHISDFYSVDAPFTKTKAALKADRRCY